jgi:plastocyanin
VTLLLILLSLVVGTPSPSLKGGVPPRRHLVEIRGFAFQPAVLQVARGDTVVWINRDIVPHTATPTGKAQWDTGTLTQGQEGRHILRRRGSFSYVCTLHPTMKGTLIVTDP